MQNMRRIFDYLNRTSVDTMLVVRFYEEKALKHGKRRFTRTKHIFDTRIRIENIVYMQIKITLSQSLCFSLAVVKEMNLNKITSVRDFVPPCEIKYSC